MSGPEILSTHYPPPVTQTPIHPILRLLRDPKLSLDLIKSAVESDPGCLAAVNQQDLFTPLHVAARRGALSVVKLLVEAGSSLDAQAAHGQTPFLVACRNAQLKVARVLVEAGCNVGLCDYGGKGAVHYAAAVGCIPILHYLNEVLHQDLGAMDGEGNTPLHIAVQERVALSRTYLLQRNCDVSVANLQGMSPVHMAAKNGGPVVMWNLLVGCSDCGRVLSMLDAEGHSPLDLAQQGKGKNHKTLYRQLTWWKSHPHFMRMSPWIYWCIYAVMTGVLMILASLSFCYLPNRFLAILVGVGLGVTSFVIPVRPHRIPHDAGWQNPAFMGAVVTELSHQCVCHWCTVLPLLWPQNMTRFSLLTLNSLMVLYFFIKIKITDPGTESVGRIGPTGTALTILDVAREEHELSSHQVRLDATKPLSEVLQFCSYCLIVRPDHTKHCKLCGKCCRGFDHHCTWLSSCIGYGNHRMFVLFLFFLAVIIVVFMWDAAYALSAVTGEDYLWNMFSERNFHVEKWLKFRFLVAICALVYVLLVLKEQLVCISKLGTVYFNINAGTGVSHQREVSLSVRSRVWIIWLFFKDYSKWFKMRDSYLSRSKTSEYV